MSYITQMSRAISRYQPEDRPALRAFQAEYFGAHSRQCDDRYSRWLFEKNPYQEPGRPSLWLCKRDGVVLGQQASIPVLLKAGDFEFKAAWGMDLMVRTEWRLKGVAPALSAAYEESADVLLGLAMSEAAHRAFVRRGWTDHGLLPFFVRPLDPHACSQTPHAPRFLARLTPEFAARGSAYAAGALLGALSGMSLAPISAFDERVDSVWAVASGDYPVLVKRDFAYLRWRFDELPGASGYHRYYLVRRGEVVGFIVTRLEPWRGSMVGRVIDYLAPRAALRPLFALVIRELNSQRAAAVFVEQLHAGVERVLRSVGCFRAPAATRFIFDARGSASRVKGLLGAHDSWYVSPGDSDLDHEISYGPGETFQRAAQATLSEQPEPESSSA